MTNTTPDQTGGDTAATYAYSVMSATFDPDTNAYAALTKLKELDGQGRIGLQAGAVVVRGDDGTITIKDQTGDEPWAGTAGGGLLGVLLGILGGPLGVLIGGTYGLFVGSLVDLGEAEQTQSVLAQIADALEPGRTTLLAELTEQSNELIDAELGALGSSSILRRPVADVEAEIAAAEKARIEAKLQADKELLQSKREHTKQQAHEKVEQLKARMPGREKAGAAS
jgi:uncharacterized membrane protein